MKRFRNFFISFITGGKYKTLHDNTDMDSMIRLIVLNITYSITSVIIISLGVTDMQRADTDMGLIQLIIGFMIFVNLLLLRTEFPFIVGGVIVTAIFGSFCVVTIFAKDELRGLAAVWIYCYPLMSIYTLGLRAGLIPASILFFVTIFRTFFYSVNFNYYYTEALLICGVYFLVLVLTAVYEYVRYIKERWLVQQDKYLNMVFDNSPDIIMLIDKDKHLLYCARFFLEKVGLKSFDEIHKTNYSDIFSRFMHTDQLSELITFFRTSKEEMNPITFERTIDLGNDGNPRHYEIHFTPMSDKNNVFQGAFVIFHDMTEILEAKERTEQASRAKSNFLANMSHEIRTPLNAIIGMTHIAKDSKDPARKDYCLDKVETASVHLLGIINDILDMSKIEEDRFELSYTEFNFSAMIQRIVSIFEFRLGEKKQKLNVYQASSVPSMIITDEQRLVQVITNLISNSIKFTPEGGSIALSIRRLEEPLSQNDKSCTLEINVTDTGIGIPVEQQSKLFNSFVQVDSSIARKFGGTGLGLAISKKIVELMQGKIMIESEENKGASFTFTIRAEIPETSVSPAKIPAGEPVSEKLPDYHNKRILLAEDVEINREIVITVLEPLGIEIIEAEDGKKAYDLFRANPGSFDLIFMDIHMPGIDGYEASRLIRAFEAEHPGRSNGVPIIAMTANVFKEDVEHCLAAGMNDHIGKPLAFDALVAILKKYLL
ncbi:MAG: response regulator [Treponema sp.]|jgi:PAS domain S-box-containing protein|nr:response regulator [Treponema sp.]